MLTTPLPDLQSWVRHFSQQEIPVLKQTLEHMRLLNDRLDNISIRDIAALVRHDPLLSLRLIRYLELHRHTSQVTDVTTLDRILLMVGLNGFFRAFNHSITVEDKLANHPEALKGCLRVCSRAYLAASIADAIATRRHDVDPAEVTTIVLLHNIAEILLWTEAPALATRIAQLLQNNPGMRSRDAQQQVLGITLHELHLELLHTWHLPKLMLHLLDAHYSEEPRVRTVALATKLARHLHTSWQDAGLPDDYNDAANLIGIEPEAARVLIRSIALANAREWRWYGIAPIATRLISA